MHKFWIHVILSNVLLRIRETTYLIENIRSDVKISANLLENPYGNTYPMMEEVSLET